MRSLIRIYKAFAYFIRHHWLTAAFILGFIVDNITLNRIDQVFDNVVLLTYVILAMVSTMLLYAGIAERFSNRVNDFLKTKAPLLMQYAFGGLLSGILIFYGRSSSLGDSWPFIVVILGIIYGNETIKDRAGRFLYNFVMFYVGLFAYVVLVVPVLLGKMGPWVFVGSGVLSLVIVYFFFRALEKIVPNFIEMQKRSLVFIIGLIYVTLNFLYFTNIIPPIPLSLKDVGVYHNVVHVFEDDTYELTYEKPKWWEWYRTSDKKFHYSKGEEIFCYASVFAPSRLETSIYHRWEYYDTEQGDWVEHSRIKYAIEGGRSDGYRGYTKIVNYTEGEWRCTVETERRQVIGREKFVITSGMKGELITKVE